MPRGVFPGQYINNPNIDKPIEEIYADIDGYSWEIYEDEPHWHTSSMLFFVVLPPLLYEGRFIKGLALSNCTDMLVERYPWFTDLFFPIAYSMFSSYPWSGLASVYFTGYDNPHRLEYYKRTHPGRAHKTFVPLEDSDFINEYVFAPFPGIEKDIDVLCVSRPSLEKNLHVVAKAIKIYHEKYGQKIRMTFLGGRNFDLNLNGMVPPERDVYKLIEEAVTHPRDYINFIPVEIQDKGALASLYSRAKVCVLGSLIEGKNRSLKEAMLCNTAVVCFKQFNQYTRADEEVFPSGAGMYAPEFDPEIMAETIHDVINNLGDFKPRQSYLPTSGRRRFFNKCVDAMPYYHEGILEYEPGKNHLNIWLDLAMHSMYQVGIEDYIYEKHTRISFARGPEQIEELINYYGVRFGIRHPSVLDKNKSGSQEVSV